MWDRSHILATARFAVGLAPEREIVERARPDDAAKSRERELAAPPKTRAAAITKVVRGTTQSAVYSTISVELNKHIAFNNHNFSFRECALLSVQMTFRDVFTLDISRAGHA
jgi:hypothetical protein